MTSNEVQPDQPSPTQSNPVQPAQPDQPNQPNQPGTVSKRLYYTDSHLLNFEGRVVESGVLDYRPYVVLDESAF